MTTTAPDYVELRPPRALRAFVERFWVHRVIGPPEERRLLPDGRMHLVWIAELGLRVAGPAQAPMSHPRLPDVLAIGATFHPGAAPYLPRVRASELVDRRVHVDAVDPVLARDVDAALSAARDPWTAVAGLQRRFVHDVGYAPKTLQRVLRLQRFLEVRTVGDLAGAAALAGYADQSHLSREARRLTGLTARELLAYQH